MSHLRDKYRHRAGRENAPARASSRALRPHSSRRGAGLYTAQSSWGVLPYTATNRMTIFRTARGRAAPVGEGRDGREEPTSQLHTCVERKVIEEIGDILEWGGGILGGDHQAGCCGFSCRGFSTRGCFLLRLPRTPSRGCWVFGLRFFRPGLLPGGGHCGL